MDFGTLEPLDFDTWAPLLNNPNRAIDISNTTPNTSFHIFDLYSPTHKGPLWQDQTIPTYEAWQTISSAQDLSAVPRQNAASLTAGTGVLDDPQTSNPETILPSSPQALEKCSCLHKLLLITEHLDHHSATGPCFNTLAVFHRVVQICERYVQCKECDESLAEILCVAALRRASVCNRQIASVTQGTAFAAAEERKFRCKIGRFETDIVLDVWIYKAVLLSELQRASSIATEVEMILGPGSVKRRLAAMSPESAPDRSTHPITSFTSKCDNAKRRKLSIRAEIICGAEISKLCSPMALPMQSPARLLPLPVELVCSLAGAASLSFARSYPINTDGTQMVTAQLSPVIERSIIPPGSC
ncbi:uncharacterized protein BDZ99DRAFT_548418 [Mytilinidion resinicola]|uniref:Uncharacterized protein n=1 Tax=Mytilinidion resinicola TaxID=574789 RepID=A0A6A6Y4R4_9PEZI|nr:uncharacterized protein BDZ99DRAFT_548418 [Mytilinidion resinicola]KAF2803014.1 hypothetical protein BDZ99DRAFT_548418 [Mytilinidion resinicola]